MAEPMIPALGRSLARDAERYNQLFLAAQASAPLDPDRFAHHLREVVAPIVEAVAALPETPEEAVDAVTQALYTRSLELASRGLLATANPSPHLHRLYTSALPRLARFLRESPSRLLSALTTALPQLSRYDEGLPTRWLLSLLSVADDCETTDELLKLGQVLAWTHGMAHFRDSALEVFRGLPPRLQELLPDEATLVERWPSAGTTTVALLARSGGFLGLDGHFVTPPMVEFLGEHLIAYDGEHHYWIHADRFGTTCLRVHEDALPPDPGLPAPVLTDELRAALPADFRKDHLSLARCGSILALTVPFSFRVYLFHVPEGAPS